MIPQHSSKTNEHFSPADIIERARRLMGGIDLDPASCAAANQRVKAATYFNRRKDGLNQPWSGRVFLNPPGGLVRMVNGRWRPVPKNANGHYMGPGDSSMNVWWEALVTKWLGGFVEQAFFVAFTLELLRTSQRGSLPVQHFPRCYPKDRLHFGGSSPTHANVLVYLPKDMNRGPEVLGNLRDHFGDVGLCEGWGSL